MILSIHKKLSMLKKMSMLKPNFEKADGLGICYIIYSILNGCHLTADALRMRIQFSNKELLITLSKQKTSKKFVK